MSVHIKKDNFDIARDYCEEKKKCNHLPSHYYAEQEGETIAFLKEFQQLQYKSRRS